MKKLLLGVALLVVGLVSGQHNFKAVDGELIWQKVYQDSLTIESQDVKFKVTHLPRLTTAVYVSALKGAEMIVEHNEGRTRVTFRNMYYNDNVSMSFGYGITAEAADNYIDKLIVKRKTGEIRARFFRRKDAGQLDGIMERKIKSLTTVTEKNF